jgi:hypothetical protein
VERWLSSGVSPSASSPQPCLLVGTACGRLLCGPLRGCGAACLSRCSLVYAIIIDVWCMRVKGLRYCFAQFCRYLSGSFCVRGNCLRPANLPSREAVTMRAAVYVRVSTQEQAREGISLAAQEEACRRMAVEAGAMEVTVYSDEGYTGSNMRRPALQQVTRGLREAAAIRRLRSGRGVWGPPSSGCGRYPWRIRWCSWAACSGRWRSSGGWSSCTTRGMSCRRRSVAPRSATLPGSTGLTWDSDRPVCIACGPHSRSTGDTYRWTTLDPRLEPSPSSSHRPTPPPPPGTQPPARQVHVAGHPRWSDHQ